MNSSDLLCFKPFSRTRRRNLCNPDRMAREEEHQRERVWEDFACLFSTAQDIGETGYDFQASSPPMMIYFLSRSPLLPFPLFLPPPSVSHNISLRSRMSAACDIKLQLRMPPSVALAAAACAAFEFESSGHAWERSRFRKGETKCGTTWAGRSCSTCLLDPRHPYIAAYYASSIDSAT